MTEHEQGELCPNRCTEVVPYLGEAFSQLEINAAGDLECFTCGWMARAVCDGCRVREPWEHRCHGSSCACVECREERTRFETNQQVLGGDSK